MVWNSEINKNPQVSRLTGDLIEHAHCVGGTIILFYQSSEGCLSMLIFRIVIADYFAILLKIIFSCIYTWRKTKSTKSWKQFRTSPNKSRMWRKQRIHLSWWKEMWWMGMPKSAKQYLLQSQMWSWLWRWVLKWVSKSLLRSFIGGPTRQLVIGWHTLECNLWSRVEPH